MKVGVTVTLSPVPPKINGRSQFRTHSLLNTFDYKNRVSDFCQVRLFCCYKHAGEVRDSK